MYMSKPSSFRRSSENTKDGEVQAVAEMRRLRKLDADERRDSFEALSYGIGGGMVAAGVVEPLDLSDSWERRVDFMEAEDLSRFDVEGVVG